MDIAPFLQNSAVFSCPLARKFPHGLRQSGNWRLRKGETAAEAGTAVFSAVICVASGAGMVEEAKNLGRMMKEDNVVGYDLQQNLKYLQQSGLPLYPSQGAAVDLWQHSLERIQ